MKPSGFSKTRETNRRIQRRRRGDRSNVREAFAFGAKATVFGTARFPCLSSGNHENSRLVPALLSTDRSATTVTDIANAKVSGRSVS